MQVYRPCSDHHVQANRKEFRPLFWRQFKSEVGIEDLPDLLATFLNSDPGSSAVWKVKVGVNEDDLFSQTSRDRLALLFAIRKHRRVSRKFKLQEPYHPPAWWKFVKEFGQDFCQIFLWLASNPPCRLLGDVTSELLTEISLRRVRIFESDLLRMFDYRTKLYL
jgi:hypothetical protein